MFDIGFWELALIGVIALLVVGPERLPALARNVGLWVGRMRRYVSHVKEDIEREIHAEEVRKLIETPAHSITEFDDAISETKSVLKEAERELSEVERAAHGLAQAPDTAAPPASEIPADTESQGPFSANAIDSLNPGGAPQESTTPAAGEAPLAAVDGDDEQRNA